LRDLDPEGWSDWYDINIPDITSPGEIIRRVQARIDILKNDPLKADGYETPMEIRASLGL